MHVDRFVEVELRVVREQPAMPTIEALLENMGFPQSTQERLLVIAYDSIEQVRTVAEIARGGYHELDVPLAPLLTAVLLAGTDRFQIIHNHPAGDTSATMLDVQLTHLVMDAANMVGLYFEDHLIVGPDAPLYSFAENGLLVRSPQVIDMAEGLGHKRAQAGR